MKQTFYQLEGSKLAEFWTILHLPYTLMAISFLTMGFGITGIQRWDIYIWVVIAYFLGLGIAAHAFDQLPGTGSNYVQRLTPNELVLLGVLAAAGAVVIGLTVMGELGAMHLVWIIPLQTFFVIAYPYTKFAKGFFHSDFWFSLSFGALPVMAGYYINTLTITAAFIPWAVVAALIAGIEITLSRYVRGRRQIHKNIMDNYEKNNIIIPHPLELDIEREHRLFIEKPERALKLLCLLSYALAIIFLWR